MLIELLNADGERVFLPHWIKNELRRLKLLTWNHPAKLWQISPAFYSLARSGFDFASVRPRQVKASDPARQRTEPDKSGRVSPLVKILGR